jgi:hypothetical protein
MQSVLGAAGRQGVRGVMPSWLDSGLVMLSCSFSSAVEDGLVFGSGGACWRTSECGAGCLLGGAVGALSPPSVAKLLLPLTLEHRSTRPLRVVPGPREAVGRRVRMRSPSGGAVVRLEKGVSLRMVWKNVQVGITV